MKTLPQIISKHGAVIFTALNAVGVLATATLAVAVTPKALEKIHKDSKEAHDDENAFTKAEAIKSSWTFYIPAAVVGVATIGCGVGSEILNKTTQRSIAAAGAMISASYNEYRDKVKEICGEETHHEIVNAIMAERCDQSVVVSGDNLLSATCLDFATEDPEVLRTFYDPFKKSYYETSIAKQIQAEYHFNRNFCMGKRVSYAEYLSFLGRKADEGDDMIGYDIYEGDLYWIDFDHRVTHLDDGMEILVVDIQWEPTVFED